MVKSFCKSFCKVEKWGEIRIFLAQNFLQKISAKIFFRKNLKCRAGLKKSDRVPRHRPKMVENCRNFWGPKVSAETFCDKSFCKNLKIGSSTEKLPKMGENRRNQKFLQIFFSKSFCKNFLSKSFCKKFLQKVSAKKKFAKKTQMPRRCEKSDRVPRSCPNMGENCRNFWIPKLSAKIFRKKFLQKVCAKRFCKKKFSAKSLCKKKILQKKSNTKVCAKTPENRPNSGDFEEQ